MKMVDDEAGEAGDDALVKTTRVHTETNKHSL